MVNNTNLKPVLFISYLYPPLKTVGAKRVQEFVRHLPTFGYAPYILTTGRYGVLADDKDKRVTRTQELDGMIVNFFRNAMRKNKQQYLNNAVDHNNPVLPIHHPSWVSRWRHHHFMPDEQITWLLNAYVKGLSLIKKYRINYVISSSPSETNHLVALLLKKTCAIHWVADFRDGWMFEPLRPSRLSIAYRRRVESFFETKVVKHCDVLLSVNDCLIQDFSRRYSAHAQKMKVISNGFDASLFDAILTDEADPNKLQIVYTGSLGLSRQGTSIHDFLQALDMIRMNNPMLYAKLKVDLFGSYTKEEQQSIVQSNVANIFAVHQSVSGTEYAKVLCCADVLLLIVDPSATCVLTSKVFDYMASTRPILALAKGTAAGDFVESQSLGKVVYADKHTEIAQSICDFAHAKFVSRIIAQNKINQYYEWKNLTQQMALHLV